MTISGGIKFFKKNKGLLKDGNSIVASSNSAQADSMIDMSKDTSWISIGSDDTTTEEITLTLAQSFTIDRILLIDINLKDFTVEYWTGSAYADFANVVGLDGAVTPGITEIAFADTTAYYEFDAVATIKIRIQALKTQVVDAEKQITSLVVTEELGTFAGWPTVTGEATSNNEKVFTNLNFKSKVFKSFDSFSFGLNFTVYPGQADYDLTETLFASVDPFIVWLCGGRRGSAYFRFTKAGYKLDDVYHMQAVGQRNPSYANSILINAINQNMRFIEAE